MVQRPTNDMRCGCYFKTTRSQEGWHQ